MNPLNNDGKPVTLEQAAAFFAELAENYGGGAAFSISSNVCGEDVLEMEFANITEKNGEAVICIDFNDEVEVIVEWDD